MSGPLSRALAGLLFVLMLVPGVSAASDDGMLVPDSAHAAAESETASVKRLRLAIVNSYGMSIMDDYYSRTIEAVKEKLTPIEIDVKIYGPDSFLKAAEKKSFDMSIASSGLTSLMIERTGGLPLAAVVSDEAPDPNYANGAAIIVRADRPELRTLEDLRGRSVAIMSRTAFAGWQIPASEMVRKGLDPEAFFSEIRVSGYPMTRIVQEVKSGEVDVGFVATCLLERMARGGQIDQKDFRVIGEHADRLVAAATRPSSIRTGSSRSSPRSPRPSPERSPPRCSTCRPHPTARSGRSRTTTDASSRCSASCRCPTAIPTTSGAS